MLHTRDYLENHSFENLIEEFGLEAAFHPTDPLVILNYGMLSPNRTHPIVCECRSLCMYTDTGEFAARSFPRFFNLHETPEINSKFDWSNFSTTTKEDGSLLSVWYDHRFEKWRINTRGSFGTGKVHAWDYTWQDLFHKCVPVNELQYWNPNLTYIFELCSPYNKVVRAYKETQLFLLTVFNGQNEMWRNNVESIYYQELALRSSLKNVFLVDTHNFKSEQEVLTFLDKSASEDPTFEGVVLHDKNGLRIKVKSAAYVHLHHMHDNGNLASPKNLLYFVLRNETDEVLSYFPELTEMTNNLKEKVKWELGWLSIVWEQAKIIESQKEFAQYIVPKTKFPAILFHMRKTGADFQSSIIKFEDYIGGILLNDKVSS